MVAAFVRRFRPLRVLSALVAAVLAMTLAEFSPASRAPARAASPASPPPADAGPAERPDMVSAQVAAWVEKRRVEVTGLRTESTSTFVNPDGTSTLDAYSGIRRVRQGDGWADVDTTLVVDGGRVVPKVASRSG
ncbi:hypothetical protein [Pseudofrankia asymbiotica]|uniref:Uncharacterized protein n=1 Tax=Pseudofrankia asymbiotica TaxID=1834516 RepID=A0A1V2IA07_9ACTN|nr:hypothetical protein [Pseudofrankia asymbiotica]ONH29499.1 hypothetical protein BL253_16665 [Pseudofrankia asymbiotica]